MRASLYVKVWIMHKAGIAQRPVFQNYIEEKSVPEVRLIKGREEEVEAEQDDEGDSSD